MWWWDLLFFCHGVMIDNAYVLFKCLQIRKGNKLLNNYKFRHQFVLEKLDPENYDSKDTVVQKKVIKRKAQQISKRSEKEAAESINAAPEKDNRSVADVSRNSWTLVGLIKSRMNFYSQQDQFAAAMIQLYSTGQNNFLHVMFGFRFFGGIVGIRGMHRQSDVRHVE